METFPVSCYLLNTTLHQCRDYKHRQELTQHDLLWEQNHIIRAIPIPYYIIDMGLRKVSEIWYRKILLKMSSQ